MRSFITPVKSLEIKPKPLCKYNFFETSYSAAMGADFLALEFADNSAIKELARAIGLVK